MENYTREQLIEALDSCNLMYGAFMTKRQLLVHIKMLHDSPSYYDVFYNKKRQHEFLKSL